VASIDTYIKYSEAVAQVPTVSRPTIEASRSTEELMAENAALRAQLAASTAREREELPARRPRTSAKL
jgi:hypothetical protein